MQTPLATRWRGYYYDGRTASRYPVIITLTRDGIQIRREEHTSLWWPFDQVRQTQGFTAGEHVRLERGGEFAEAIVVTDEGFLAAIRHIAPHVRARFQAPPRRSMRLVIALIALAGVIVLGTTIYLWGIPAVADAAASRVPVAWEERLGQDMVDAFIRPRQRCRNSELLKALDRIASTLTAAAPGSPYTFRIVVADLAVVNALAAPGGHLVIFRGLLEETNAPEELAGVLAHEMQHVLHRHGTRAIFRDMSLGLLLSVVTGGGNVSTLEVARALGGLRYRRSDEEAADREGMKMIQAARIDPNGMVAMYELLQRETGRVEPPPYLSSHPRTADRLEQLKRQASGARYAPIRLLPGIRWTDFRAMCK